ncbi:SRPBCC family protein [Nocardia jejuensis]|uniref:SRPBCC family protein n=1 Tax=Nocardia jejuensis TaxID=328049 RepID=UPI0008350395|nr:SRPBCC domain-containing protein [Nocardia jejuensis]
MVDILHRVAIKSPAAEVYSALTSVEGLSGWWASDTTGKGDDIGGVVQFRFGPGGIDMKVVELDADKRVLWEVVDGPEEWIGTHVEWALAVEDEYTTVMFRHLGWKEPVDFMHHCSTKWAVFLLSLKSLVETGTGAPDPRDVKIDTWN